MAEEKSNKAVTKRLKILETDELELTRLGGQW